ncbi:FecR family protein [Pseudomonas sp. 8Z]|uniref:FecR family protein n=1 Tax=Pseudomonas sp. 8Z TaxID=2653166 RepID=UPI0012EFB8CA|nr:FecR family protein [Pseudomonas sp. 8Z]VXD04826.1 FecR family protein [Pseudomonas sp. 8Z]
MPPHDSDATLSQALDWLLLLEHADDDCRAQFAEWLAASPANAEAFERAQQCWQSSTLATAAAHLEQSRQPQPKRSRRLGRSLAIAATLLLVVGITLQSDLLLRLRADHVTAVGQRQSLDLADGSHVLLNTDSAFSSQIDAHQRVTQLLRGEAYFDVAKDNYRPFQVDAGPVRISVRGTAFSVRYLDDSAEVSVERGEIEVYARGNDTHTYLASGDSIRIGPNGVGTRIHGATAHQLAWVQGRLIFDDRPLREVLDELRRYYPGWIINRNAHLNDLRITGNYRLSEPTDIMRSLAQVASAQLQEYPALLILN